MSRRAALTPGSGCGFETSCRSLHRGASCSSPTHIVSDVEYIAAQNVIMKEGGIICAGKTEELLVAVAGKVFTAVIRQDELPRYEEAVVS